MDESSRLRDKIMLRLTRSANLIASGGTGELKKIGKSVTSQVIGSKPPEPQSQTTESPQDAGFSILNELKMLGKSATSQVSGSRPPSSQQITQMAQRDRELSQKDADAVRERILQIYREYEEKRKKQIQAQAQQEQQQEKEQEKQEEASRLKDKRPVSLPIAKSKPETGRNWGAE